MAGGAMSRPPRRARRLAHLLLLPGAGAALAFVLVARALDAGFFYGLSRPQLYVFSAAIVALAVLPLVLLALALLRLRLVRAGGRRWAVPQEWSADQLRAWTATLRRDDAQRPTPRGEP